MERSTVVLLSILSLALVGIVGAEEEPDLLNGELWKAQVLDELIRNINAPINFTYTTKYNLARLSPDVFV